MARIAWVMKLKPGQEAAYKEKHDQIWPEMLALMRQQEIGNFSIFSDGTKLFAYQERDSEPQPGTPHSPVLLRWWKMMEPYMDYNPDGTPWVQPLREVFHADLSEPAAASLPSPS